MSLFSFSRKAPARIEPDGLSGPDAREAWHLHGLGPGPADRHARFARLAEVLARLTVDDFVVLGLLKRPRDRFHTGSYGAEDDGSGAGTLCFTVSPEGRRQALEWRPDGGDGSDLWVDGRPVDGPRDATGLLPLDGPGAWCGERIHLTPFVPDEHPLQDWTEPFSRGVQRGALLVDAVTGRQWTELPGADELWSFPIGREVGSELLLFADPEARDAGRVSRRVPL
ncbi:hypothetical protein [Piscinibacter gummiphilus]|uniref:Uncharacterized protein n=1 Tax=Piscinibacter gummiphilus TaxID=946333 RepID=A0A1W6L6Q3_9BURK|nr:hypothetical protein [Piscinibacter gummiphilus]ARN19818.1 hypothetical protein A4W93_07770 [Piscinibacter gummiphilus]ATU64488.1 hypothetical protein CPZ87_07850 [Piscinibacter gummiphilus]